MLGKQVAAGSLPVVKGTATRMPEAATTTATRRLRWTDVYCEAELYKAAIRVYTKPVFQWRKALGSSTDGKTFYEFASNGLGRLGAIHRSLEGGDFEFRPAIALDYNFNGRHRTLYISPWEERIVDLLLYRVLNRRMHGWFSRNSYAYRDRGYGLDSCQSRIARRLRAEGPLYVVKRDISDYFASINHELLLGKLASLVDPADYLYHLLFQRVAFSYEQRGCRQTAKVGIPFGTAIACLFANIYLTDLDREVESVPGLHYFRYADDILLLSANRETAVRAAERLELLLTALRLKTKPSHRADILLTDGPPSDPGFLAARDFRHLGLLFRAGGGVALSRDKLRKIQNLFRFAFRRKRRQWKRVRDPGACAQVLVNLATETVEKAVRNVAILDYYLKHVDDERQLRMLDRWLAEEVLSRVFGGHKKGHFRKISFRRLRGMGLPSLLHRRRMIRRGLVETPFFVWQGEKAARAFRGTVARLCRSTGKTAFSPFPEAAANITPVREGGCL
jgi:hypothetical protein